MILNLLHLFSKMSVCSKHHLGLSKVRPGEGEEPAFTGIYSRLNIRVCHHTEFSEEACKQVLLLSSPFYTG